VGKGKWQAIHSQGKTVSLWTTGFYVISEVCESLLNVFEKFNAKLIKIYIESDSKDGPKSYVYRKQKEAHLYVSQQLNSCAARAPFPLIGCVGFGFIHFTIIQWFLTF